MIYDFIDVLLRILPWENRCLSMRGEARYLHGDLIWVCGDVVGCYQKGCLKRPYKVARHCENEISTCGIHACEEVMDLIYGDVRELST